MAKFYLFVISLMFITQFSFGQSVLKKKDVGERLGLISNNIEIKNYEEAMAVFYSSIEVIQIDKVPKDKLADYYFIDSVLKEKRLEFDSIAKLVDYYNLMYNAEKFCKVLDLGNLSLTKENSYQKSRDIKARLDKYLPEIAEKCKENKKKIIGWQADFDSNNYENIYHILNIKLEKQKYYSEDDKSILRIIQKQIKPEYNIYKEVRRIVVIEPIIKLDSINKVDINISNQVVLITDLENDLRMIKEIIQDVEGENPNLMFEYNYVILRINEMIAKLNEPIE